MPARHSDVAILQAGLLFAKEVGPRKDAFIGCGLPATFAEELQQAVATFEQAIAGRQAGKTGSAVSMVAIRTALRQGVDAVDSLDVLVRNTLGSDIKALAAWKRDRHVYPVRADGAGSLPPAPMPESPAEPPVPPPGEPAPAASEAAWPATVAGDQPQRRAS